MHTNFQKRGSPSQQRHPRIIFRAKLSPKKQAGRLSRAKRKTRLQPPTRRSTSRPRDRTAEKNQTPSDLRFEPREPSLVSPRPRQNAPHQQRNLFPSTFSGTRLTPRRSPRRREFSQSSVGIVAARTSPPATPGRHHRRPQARASLTPACFLFLVPHSTVRQP